MKPLLIANWKMNLSLAESERAISILEKGAHAVASVEMVVLPSLAFATPLASEAHMVKIGAQNFFPKDNGSYTGEISVNQAREFASFVLIGHSERKKYFHETSEGINAKIAAAISHGLTPIVCLGEDAQEKAAGATARVINAQFLEYFHDVHIESHARIILAYEPVWAISSTDGSKVASKSEILEGVKILRHNAEERFGRDVNNVQIIYGGSTDEKNCEEIFSLPEVEGALVGKASLDPESFLAVAHKLQEARR